LLGVLLEPAGMAGDGLRLSQGGLLGLPVRPQAHGAVVLASRGPDEDCRGEDVGAPKDHLDLELQRVDPLLGDQLEDSTLILRELLLGGDVNLTHAATSMYACSNLSAPMEMGHLPWRSTTTSPMCAYSASPTAFSKVTPAGLPLCGLNLGWSPHSSAGQPGLDSARTRLSVTLTARSGRSRTSTHRGSGSAKAPSITGVSCPSGSTPWTER